MVIAVPTFLNADGDGTAVPDQDDGWFDLLAQARPITLLWDETCRFQCSTGRARSTTSRGRLMTPSQANSPSAPEAIEDQQQSGGPYGTLSLVGGTVAKAVYSLHISSLDATHAQTRRVCDPRRARAPPRIPRGSSALARRSLIRQRCRS